MYRIKSWKSCFRFQNEIRIGFVSIGMFAVSYVKTNFFPKTSIFLTEIDLPVLKPNYYSTSPAKQA